MNAPSPTPSWIRPAGLFAAVSAVILGLALWQPFEPSGAAVDAGLVGDPTAGQALYANGCAGCHGADGGGGAGPVLQERELTEDAVAGVIANGRGTMPAGIFAGQEAQDVAAFVAQLSGGAVAAAPEVDDAEPADPGPAAPAAAGRVQLFGENLWGVEVTLNAPAPADWTVWLDGPDGLSSIGEILVGGRGLREPNVGPPPVIDVYDRVLIGADAAAPALSASIPPAESDRMRRINNAHPDTPGGVALLDGAVEEIDVLLNQDRLLFQATTNGDLAGLRKAGEQFANVVRGAPGEDLDGDGTISAPGDGFGLVSADGDGGYFPLLRDAAPDVPREVADAVQNLAASTADRAAECAAASDAASAAECAAAVRAGTESIAAQWAAVQEGVIETLGVDLLEEAP